jgi:hypothetical protein
MLAVVVDGDALLQVLWVSFVAGIGLTLAFSLAIASGARAGQARRSGSTSGAAAWYVVTGVCGLLCAAAVVLGVLVMLSK